MQKISDVVKLGLVLEPVELLVRTAYTVAKLWFNFVAKILHHHDEDTKNENVETDKQVNVFRRHSCENKLSNSGKGKEESGLAISICRDKSEQGGCRKSTSRREFSSGNLIARRILATLQQVVGLIWSVELCRAVGIVSFFFLRLQSREKGAEKGRPRGESSVYLARKAQLCVWPTSAWTLAAGRQNSHTADTRPNFFHRKSALLPEMANEAATMRVEHGRWWQHHKGGAP